MSLFKYLNTTLKQKYLQVHGNIFPCDYTYPNVTLLLAKHIWKFEKKPPGHIQRRPRNFSFIFWVQQSSFKSFFSLKWVLIFIPNIWRSTSSTSSRTILSYYLIIYGHQWFKLKCIYVYNTAVAFILFSNYFFLHLKTLETDIAGRSKFRIPMAINYIQRCHRDPYLLNYSKSPNTTFGRQK